MIREQWPILIIDLKDCFYTVPLHEKESPRFAFTVPSLNNKKPVKRYTWKVLPQGMINSPTLCQTFVATPLQNIRRQFPDAYVTHYTDDILLPHKDPLKKIYLQTG